MTDHDRASSAADSDELAGAMTSVFHAEFPQELDTSIAASAEEPPTGSALLVVKRGPTAGSRFLLDLDKAVTFAGRHPDSDIVLDDVTVSRRHAEFRVKENNDVQIVDAGSLNGTYVNRVPVDSATLANGDEVRLGKFRLVFLSGGSQPAKMTSETE